VRAVVQRCLQGRVEVDGAVVGAVGRGLVVFVGAGREDTDRDLTYLADKIAHLRIFEDDQGKMNRSALDVGGGILAVSQFTLYGDCRKGRRPSFGGAMDPAPARGRYLQFVKLLRDRGLEVATGQFQADMRVIVDNDGPVTILLDSTRQF